MGRPQIVFSIDGSCHPSSRRADRVRQIANYFVARARLDRRLAAVLLQEAIGGENASASERTFQENAAALGFDILLYRRGRKRDVRVSGRKAGVSIVDRVPALLLFRRASNHAAGTERHRDVDDRRARESGVVNRCALMGGDPLGRDARHRS